MSKACIPSGEFEKTIKMSVAATDFSDERLLIILTSVPLCYYHHEWQVLEKLITLNNKFFIIFKCLLFLTVTKCRYEICLILQALTEHINRFVLVIIGGRWKFFFLFLILKEALQTSWKLKFLLPRTLAENKKQNIKLVNNQGILQSIK